jgi:hypothetical protein
VASAHTKEAANVAVLAIFCLSLSMYFMLSDNKTSGKNGFGELPLENQLRDAPMYIPMYVCLSQSMD